MAERRPLVRNPNTGRREQIKSGDTVPLEILPKATISSPIVYGSAEVSNITTAYQIVSGMTFTMAEAGNYDFSGNLQVRAGLVNGSGMFAIFKNNVLVPTSERELTINTAILTLLALSSCWWKGPIFLSDRITCAANDVIDIRYKSLNGERIYVNSRNFKWLRVI